MIDIVAPLQPGERCTFTDCVRKRRTKGLCSAHYKQRLRGTALRPVGERAKPRPLLSSSALSGVLFVQLTRGYFALIDEADAGTVGAKNWCIYKNGRRRYAVSSFVHADGNKKPISLHLFLWGDWNRPPTPEIDHRNTDGLDCRRRNIRAATLAQNRWNRGAQANNTSGHKGVSWNKAIKRWDARIKADGIQRYLGLFDTIEAAGAAYKRAARKLHGAFARIESTQ